MAQREVAEALYQAEVAGEDPAPPLAAAARRIQTLTVAVANYETGGRRPRGPVLRSLATVLGVDVLDLLTEGAPVTLPVLRARLGLGQDQVAEALGMSRALYGTVEQGRRRLTEDEVAALAQALKAEPERAVLRRPQAVHQ